MTVTDIMRFLKLLMNSDFSPSFAQEGEDMILKYIFDGRKQGFYVDVGAFHPTRFSNTYYFYLQGWSGINIDARPGCMNLFNMHRSRDINLEIAISDTENELTYYEFNEPALNSFSPELSFQRSRSKRYTIIARKKIRTQRLADVLDRYLPSDRKIDFLNIDVEGLDYSVLSSNDWYKYKPFVVLIEDLHISLEQSHLNTQTVHLLMNQGYRLLCKTINTLIFKLNS